MTPGVVSSQRAKRFAAWIDEKRWSLIVLSLVIIVVGGFFASRMTLKSSLTALLPESTRSVRDLNAIELRARRFGTIHIVLDAPDAQTRERAGTALARHLQTDLPKELVAQLIVDDSTQQQYGWANRFLFADTKDLLAARDALIERVQHAKLEANPLYIQLDDEPADPEHDKLAELEKKLADAEEKVKHPRLRISANGRMQ